MFTPDCSKCLGREECASNPRRQHMRYYAFAAAHGSFALLRDPFARFASANAFVQAGARTPAA
jgi:hypothetical protein